MTKGQQDAVLAMLVAARDALLHADSMLSLIRHRAGIQTWGTVGMATEQEADKVIGETRQTWDVLLRFLSKGKQGIFGQSDPEAPISSDAL